LEIPRWTESANSNACLLRLLFDGQGWTRPQDRRRHSGKTAQVHRKNSLASPTPILSQDRVYVHFGPYCTACLSTAGEIL